MKYTVALLLLFALFMLIGCSSKEKVEIVHHKEIYQMDREEVINAYKSGEDAVNALRVKYPFLADYESVNITDLAKDGGRIGMQEGGIMNLGGMEKDYRNTGGFVEIGGKERADDVPARLSRNEFVFTADAVRNAGGGDIDKGAEIMEKVMDNLEAGGKISEESQGMRGAQEMFEVSERLSEVV